MLFNTGSLEFKIYLIKKLNIMKLPRHNEVTHVAMESTGSQDGQKRQRPDMQIVSCRTIEAEYETDLNRQALFPFCPNSHL
jgi:hypothetical protein